MVCHRNRSRNHAAALVVACIVFGLNVIESTVVIGNQVLRNSSFELLQGHSVAILTNPSGVFPDTLQHIVDHLHFETDVHIAAILAPEHGFRGDHQAEAGDPDSYIDKATNLTVFSVYRKNTSDIQQILSRCGATLLLVDVQDVGTRLYTFIWTMFDVMMAIANSTVQNQSKGIEVIVLDRPNPVGGLFVEGPTLNVSCCTSRYGKAAVTHRHGLTIGELARLFDGESFNGTLQRHQVFITRC